MISSAEEKKSHTKCKVFLKFSFHGSKIHGATIHDNVPEINVEIHNLSCKFVLCAPGFAHAVRLGDLSVVTFPLTVWILEHRSVFSIMVYREFHPSKSRRCLIINTRTFTE